MSRCVEDTRRHLTEIADRPVAFGAFSCSCIYAGNGFGLVYIEWELWLCARLHFLAGFEIKIRVCGHNFDASGKDVCRPCVSSSIDRLSFNQHEFESSQ